MAGGMTTRIMRRMLAGYGDASPAKKRLISLFMHYFPGQITCQQFGAFMAEYFDGELPLQSRRKFELHLQGCPMCQVHLEEYRAAIALAKADERDPPAVPITLIELILETRGGSEENS